MTGETSARRSSWHDVVDAALARAESLLAAVTSAPAAEAPSEGRAILAGVREDPETFEYTRRLLELVIGTDDAFTSAIGLREMAHDVPDTMPPRERLALRAGGAVSLGMPWAVMPVARRFARERVSQLVLAAKLPSGAEPGRLAELTEGVRRHTDGGFVAVIRPLGEGVHGPAAAARDIDRTVGLVSHPAVHHITIDPARLAPGATEWSVSDDVARAASGLRPILQAAAATGTTVHLEPRSVLWAQRVVDVLERATADAVLDRARIGVRLFAELPESRALYARLSRWAQRRVADGGAPSEVTIGCSEAVGTERIASLRTGLPVSVATEPREQLHYFLSLVELALHPGRAASLRPVIASEDPVILSGVLELAAQFGAASLFSLQLRAGVSPALARTIAGTPVNGTTPETRILLPVSDPREFGGAVETLVRYASEAADPESVLSRLERHLGSDPALVRSVIAGIDDPKPETHRTQDRAREWDPSERDSALFYRPPAEPARFDTGGLTAAVLGLIRGSDGEARIESVIPARPIPIVSESGFANEPDTDPAVRANREWASTIIDAAAEDVADRDDINATLPLTPLDLEPERTAAHAVTVSAKWRALGHAQRAQRLRRLALGAVAARDRLLRTLTADTGSPVALVDREISATVDAARYAGLLAENLSAVRGATFVPDGVGLVAGDAAAGLAAHAEAVLALLAAGSGVLWAAPATLGDSAHALVEEWEAAGLPAGSVVIEIPALGRGLRELAADYDIDRALVLGDAALARDLAHRRPGLRVEGRFAARGTNLVSPSADIDRAIDSIVVSAFQGSPLSRAGAVIMWGSVARSVRFRAGLVDAVNRLRVGDTSRAAGDDPLTFDIGPLPAPATDAQRAALTRLERGESWLVKPVQLDDEGRLWRPGIKTGVKARSSFWNDAVGAPVIGLTHARTFAEAMRFVGAPGSGAVAAIHSTDSDEIADWLARAEAATLAVNRPTSDVLVERQPVGGWNDAVMGMPALSGGPNRLLTLGSWILREGTRSETLHLRGLETDVAALIEVLQPELAYEEFDQLRRAALADSLVWRTAFAPDRDIVELGVERNMLRYRPVHTQLRLAENGRVVSLARVIAAAMLVRAPITVSTSLVLPGALQGYLDRAGVEVSLESDDDWLERLAVSGPVNAEGERAARIRLIGGDPIRTSEWLGGLDRVSVWADPVTMAGPVELLTLVREQAVTACAHRYGIAVPVPGLDE